MNRIEEKQKFASLGNSHMAFWVLDVYLPQWECLNYGAPGEGLAYVESSVIDTSDCQVVVQFGTNNIYRLNGENIDEYVGHYVKAVLAVPSLKTYLFCIFPRNDYDNYSTAVDKFVQILSRKIHEKLQETDVVYLDVFNRLLRDSRLNPELTLDDLHLNGKGCSILIEALRQVSSL